MKKTIILFGCIFLLQTSINAQDCIDTLFWKVRQQYFGIVFEMGTPLNGYTRSIFKNVSVDEDYVMTSFCLKYLGSRSERFDHNSIMLFGKHYLEVLVNDTWVDIPDESHIVRTYPGYYDFNKENEYESGWGASFCFSCQIKNNGLSLPAQFRMIVYIDSSSFDGKFCDSIVKLSADTAYFTMIDGDTLPNNGISTTGQEYISLFPNPAQSQFTVTNVQNALLRLYNTLGQEVICIRSEKEHAMINTNHLPQGLYVLKVEKENAVLTKKVQIVK